MTGSIICGLDESESAKGAARVARGLSSMLGLRLVFVRVVEPGSTNSKISAIAERLERLSERATEVDRGAGWLVDVGHPVDRLVAAAADEEARFVVLGSTGPRSSLLGSVSAEVSRRAPCPVVVVPPGADTSTKVQGDGQTQFAGGIAHFEASSEGDQPAIADRSDASDVAGGILRFSPRGHRSPRVTST